MIRCSINGEVREFPDGASIADLVSALGLTGARVAVERNRDLVRRTDHATTRMVEGDQIEVVTLVGGG